MSTPEPKTVREIATEIILDCGRNADDVGTYVWVRVGSDLSKHEHEAWCSAIRSAIRTAVVTVEWPDEQQPADVVTAEQQQDGAAEDVVAFLDAWEAAGLPDAVAHTARGSREGERPGIYRQKLTVQMLRAVLAERTVLAARVAELESEREADTRAVVTLLRFGYVPSEGNWMTDGEVVGALRDRFANRIAALDADTDGGAE